MHEMGRVPAENDEVVVRGWRIKVIRMIGLRIVHVLLTKLP
jgi:CBS domain containing-hemolysin-like protein